MVVGHNVPMPMRTDCKHYESRSYASGETVRKCRLGRAPEAPWRCPEDCPVFVKRRADVGWQYGSLSTAMATEPDDPPGRGEDAAAVLDAAENVLNEAGPEIVAELGQRKRKKRKKRHGWRRRKRKG